MRTLFSLLIAFLLAVSSITYADKPDDNTPLLTVENEEGATATPEQVEVEVFVEMNLVDQTNECGSMGINAEKRYASEGATLR